MQKMGLRIESMKIPGSSDLSAFSDILHQKTGQPEASGGIYSCVFKRLFEHAAETTGSARAQKYMNISRQLLPAVRPLKL